MVTIFLCLVFAAAGGAIGLYIGLAVRTSTLDLPPGTTVVQCQGCKQLNRIPIERRAQKPLCGQCRKALDLPKHTNTKDVSDAFQNFVDSLTKKGN